ncbi:MAG: type II toxin-antitoxin system RelE/ParE family toxin [Terracidiphilus sp.]
MIKSFRHAGIERFFFTGSKAGIQPNHAEKLNLQLTINSASSAVLRSRPERPESAEADEGALTPDCVICVIVSDLRPWR